MQKLISALLLVNMFAQAMEVVEKIIPQSQAMNGQARITYEEKKRVIEEKFDYDVRATNWLFFETRGQGTPFLHPVEAWPEEYIRALDKMKQERDEALAKLRFVVGDFEEAQKDAHAATLGDWLFAVRTGDLNYNCMPASIKMTMPDGRSIVETPQQDGSRKIEKISKDGISSVEIIKQGDTRTLRDFFDDIF